MRAEHLAIVLVESVDPPRTVAHDRANAVESGDDAVLGRPEHGRRTLMSILPYAEAAPWRAGPRIRRHRTPTGEEIWTTAAQLSQWGALLARTDPSTPRRDGIS